MFAYLESQQQMARISFKIQMDNVSIRTQLLKVDLHVGTKHDVSQHKLTARNVKLSRVGFEPQIADMIMGNTYLRSPMRLFLLFSFLHRFD